MIAASLVAFVALPAAAQLQPATPYDAGTDAAGRPPATLLPDERDQPLQMLALVGPTVAIGILTIAGLMITFRGLRHDLRHRRIRYRPRRH